MSRDAPVLNSKHSLDEPCNAGRRLQVAYICFDSAQMQRLCATAEDSTKRVHLDGVTERCSRAMGFDVAYVVRCDTCIRKRSTNSSLLLGMP